MKVNFGECSEREKISILEQMIFNLRKFSKMETMMH